MGGILRKTKKRATLDDVMVARAQGNSPRKKQTWTIDGQKIAGSVRS
jgi:hypothetical protein